MQVQLERNGNDVVLLLTATVRAGDVIFCDRRDSELRLADYLYAFKFWIGEPLLSRIVLVENSGYDLSAFQEIVDRRARKDLEVELLSFVQKPFARTLGKSYGEAKIVEHAFEHSRLLADAGLVIKCTGRYFATNFFRVWPSFSHETHPYAMVNFYQYPTVCDSRLFAAQPTFYTAYFATAAQSIDDSQGYYFERALADATHAARADGHSVQRLPGGGLLIDGVQASTNTAYAYPYWKRIAYRIVALVRNKLPLRVRVGAPIHLPGQGSKT